MNIMDFFRGKPKKEDWSQAAAKAIKSQKQGKIEATNYGYQYPIYQNLYDGEKNTGELGAPVDYLVDYQALRYRGHQQYMESDQAKVLVNAYIEWMIGPGLKCESEPKESIIELSGYAFDKDSFVKSLEERFRLYAKSRKSSYSGMYSTHELARKAMEYSLVGGDCLVLNRYDGKKATIDVIDGRHICNPNPKDIEAAKARGNEVVHGVEISKKKEHIAYFIKKDIGEYTRIERIGSKTGREQAVMIFGDEFRIDGIRGVPIYTRSIEKMKKIDRYIEAMVGGAEERANVAYFFTHNHFSDGEHPLAGSVEEAAGEGQPYEEQGGSISEASKVIAKTSNKIAANLPIGSDLKAIESTIEMRLPEFVEGNFIYISASLSIPIEIVIMKFTESFSASRMSSQMWQQILDNKRPIFASRFYKPFCDLFMETEILKGNIQAPGYLEAVNKDDIILVEAYTNTRWTGPTVPQADPNKEVKAEVLKLQNKLTTHEKVAEKLGDGDWSANIDILSQEYEKIKEAIPIEYQSPPNAETDSAELPEDAE
jgi:capsid protein